MRNLILAGLVATLGPVALLVLERFVARGDSAWRWAAVACIVGGVLWLLLQDPAWSMLRKPSQNRGLTTVVAASASAAVVGAVWFLLVAAPRPATGGSETSNEPRLQHQWDGRTYPQGRFIRESITTLLYELRQASGREFREECILQGPERLTPAMPPMSLHSLGLNARFTVVNSLLPLKTAMVGVESGHLFTQSPPNVGGSQVAVGYERVFEEFSSMFSMPWVVAARRYVDGVPLSGNETWDICLYGLRGIDEAILQRVAAALDEAERSPGAGRE